MAPYVSPLREAQAAQTRLRILEAAVRVFSESGYAGTSLARIAAEAGVSLETFKQHGPKAALLLASFDHAFSGAEGDGPLHARELGAQASALPPSELLGFLADFITEANARIAHLWPRLVDAASSDPAVEERLDALQASRRSDMAAAIAMLRDKGVCTSTRPDPVLAAELSFLISPESYTQLVSGAGWSHAVYRSWIVSAVDRLVMRD